jgi:hypothetical protein
MSRIITYGNYKMTNTNRLFSSLGAATLVLGLSLNFTACSNDSPLAPAAQDQNGTLAKRPTRTTATTASTTETFVAESAYPQTGSVTVQYKRNEYRGGDITLPNGSTFYFIGGALTPPADTPSGEPVTITLTAEKIGNELQFSFGPSGCRFEPAATVELSWKDLDIDVPRLYYIDSDDSYIEQQPADIDVQGKWMLLNIHHFSRYAFAWSE